MSDTIHTSTIAMDDEGRKSGVSWGAIIAGGTAAAAITLVLVAFGAGMGFSVISPWSDSGVSAGAFGVAGGIYLVIVATISSAVGGHLAGRLRRKWIGVDADELYFRDTAHGFLTWAFATVVGAAFLAGAATHIVAATSGGLAAGAGVAATRTGGPMDVYADTLLRTNLAASRTVDPAATRSEVSRLFATRFANGGDLTPADRTYLAVLVAGHTGLSQTEAEQRISEVATDVKTALDRARRTARNIALWLTASLFMGAFAASLAATEGGGLREGTWKYRAI